MYKTTLLNAVFGLVVFGCSDVLIGASKPGGSRESGGKDADGDTESDSSLDGDTDLESDGDSVIEECEPSDDYDSLGAVCYIDSVNGDDSNSGLSEEEPLKTQAAIGSGCVVARYKRGSRFDEKLRLLGNAKVYTNFGDAGDPLPKFVVPSEPMSGPVVQSVMYNGITIDGLYIAGARSDGTIENLMGGICVFLGANSKVLNSEITDCEIGAMLSGEGSLFQGNHVHDLILGVAGESGDDPNLVGGAGGVFINASDNEVAYNTFVNCLGFSESAVLNGTCDGGATEVTVTACEEISDIEIHHNLSVDNCGFLEVATYFGDCKGAFTNSNIYNNVSVDSAWLGFLQVNNTDFDNIRYYNNTVVQREGSASAGYLWIIFTGTSSGMTGGDLLPNTVFLTNNLFVFDGVTPLGNPIDADFEQTTNLLIHTDETDPGFVDISGATALDFDLAESSPAVNAGTMVSGNTLDFMNRTIADPSGLADVGAYEYGSSQAACLPPRSPR